eukprot:TRINITY_DN82945_c0_g1_i1.p1 TRINITY_DN82945_c0_g1~~TRINITY_DN82945_c0_g1_i1.p1  ORF type:complete len:178 (-),score=33.64 TRINITY_DN82945_c0_g1_i1:425-958(-)
MTGVRTCSDKWQTGPRKTSQADLRLNTNVCVLILACHLVLLLSIFGAGFLLEGMQPVFDVLGSLVEVESLVPGLFTTGPPAAPVQTPSLKRLRANKTLLEGGPHSEGTGGLASTPEPRLPDWEQPLASPPAVSGATTSADDVNIQPGSKATSAAAPDNRVFTAVELQGAVDPSEVEA